MPHAVYFLVLAVVAIIVTVSLVKAAKANNQSYNTVMAESYADASNAAVEACQRRQRAYARYVTTSGRALTAEILAVRADGNFELRRRGHRHSAPFVRPVSEVFPR